MGKETTQIGNVNVETIVESIPPESIPTDSTYTIQELVEASIRFKQPRFVVLAALRSKKKLSYTIKEAEEVIKSFLGGK